MNGIINVFKPPGMTSHDVVSYVRKNLNMKKVGHTGTLDPGAVGVLPICVGKATRIADLLTSHDKEYRAEIQLGITTDTQDSFGQVLEQREVNVSVHQVQEAVHSFIGEIEQIPPMYSAIKIHGQKLYELARKGVEVKRELRRVILHDIKVIDIDLNSNTIMVDVRCSKGTYIRTLCYDIGEKLGCGAHMSFLLRTRSGRFKLEDTVTVEEIARCAEGKSIDKILLPVESIFAHFPSITVNSTEEKKVINGNTVVLKVEKRLQNIGDQQIYRVYNQQGLFLCLSKLEKRVDEAYNLILVKGFY